MQPPTRRGCTGTCPGTTAAGDPPSLGPAPVVPPPGDDEPVQIAADAAEYDQGSEVVRLRGRRRDPPWRPDHRGSGDDLRPPQRGGGGHRQRLPRTPRAAHRRAARPVQPGHRPGRYLGRLLPPDRAHQRPRPGRPGDHPVPGPGAPRRHHLHDLSPGLPAWGIEGQEAGHRQHHRARGRPGRHPAGRRCPGLVHPLSELPHRQPAPERIPDTDRRGLGYHWVRSLHPLLLQHRPQPGRDPDAPHHGAARAHAGRPDPVPHRTPARHPAGARSSRTTPRPMAMPPAGPSTPTRRASSARAGRRPSTSMRSRTTNSWGTSAAPWRPPARATWSAAAISSTAATAGRCSAGCSSSRPWTPP